MRVRFICGYWSKLTDQVLGSRPADYRSAYLYVWAVKHGSYKSPFYIIKSDGKRTDITPNNFDIVRRAFGSFVEKRILEEGWDQEPLLVAAPSRCAVVGENGGRSSTMLREAMAHTPLAKSIFTDLRWTKRMKELNKGGERGREQAREHLVCATNVRGRRVVIIDDLLTRGGTLLASKDVLEAAGATVVGAITVGRTMYDRSIEAFGRQTFELTQELADFETHAQP